MRIDESKGYIAVNSNENKTKTILAPGIRAIQWVKSNEKYVV